MRLYLKDKKGRYNAVAEFNYESKQFVVIEGSRVSDTISSSPTFRGAKTVIRLREKYVTDNIVTENVTFKSSSTAANFITGYSTDGPSTWKGESGKTLKDIERETKE